VENPVAMTKEEAVFDALLQQALQQGWIVVSDGPSGAQLSKKKTMRGADKVCLVLGIFGLLLYGLGIILIAIAVLDYAFFTKEQTAFLSRTNPVPVK
jgi:hypothetical protein